MEHIGISIPEILLPAKECDLYKWSVVACDQYTSQIEYWDKVKDIVGNSPSTFHLILPEIYLEEKDVDLRIEKINKTMNEYLRQNILCSSKPCFIYVDRKTSHSPSRKGLILAVDLEKYDYSPGSQTLIRATEGTVVERIPPRLRIRENASIELPHIMLLIDDPDDTVIGPLSQNIHRLEKVYDFDLMMGGGHIQGYKVEDENIIADIVHALNKLASPKVFNEKYGFSDYKAPLLFAVGDGNHSLATAKSHWENIKKKLPEDKTLTHPARYALVEVVNVHDKGITFEPIHRILFNANPKLIEIELIKICKDMDPFFRLFDCKESCLAEVDALRKQTKAHVIPFVAEEEYGLIAINKPKQNLEVGSLQFFLDAVMKKYDQIKIDYIHGEDVLTSLAAKEGNIGFILPSMKKQDLFKTVILDGTLPRKTFSMGEAEEKRFYLECRKIC
ncbi:MAG TPA: DUF1015 domain-containing protein [Clostridiaceae bacterium]|nr:DUF1015 domain-containing protein [Clostridiaceae bacterium]